MVVTLLHCTRPRTECSNDLGSALSAQRSGEYAGLGVGRVGLQTARIAWEIAALGTRSKSQIGTPKTAVPTTVVRDLADAGVLVADSCKEDRLQKGGAHAWAGSARLAHALSSWKWSNGHLDKRRARRRGQRLGTMGGHRSSSCLRVKVKVLNRWHKGRGESEGCGRCGRRRSCSRKRSTQDYRCERCTRAPVHTPLVCWSSCAYASRQPFCIHVTGT